MRDASHYEDPLPECLPSFKVAAAFAAAAVVIAAGTGAFDDGEAAAVTAGLVVEAKERCAVRIEQFGPGERWSTPSSLRRVPACAGAVVPAPNHILTYPVRGPE